MKKTFKRFIGVMLSVIMILANVFSVVAAEGTYFSVAGTDNLCGVAWSPDAAQNKMTLNEETGLYEITFKDVAAGTFEFKVTDGTWNNSWPGSNVQGSLAKTGDVLITFNASTNEVKWSSDAAGEPEITEDKYRVAGVSELCGSAWNASDDNNLMTWNEESNRWEKVYENVAAGTYTYKITKNGSTWIPDGMGNDSSVTVEEDGSTVTIYYVEGSAAGAAEVTVPEAAPLQVKIHYSRPDGNYEGWNIFTWTGSSTPFEAEEGGVVSTITPNPGAEEIGFIVRYSTTSNEWQDREQSDDADGNRFVDISGYTSGTIHVYVESGVLTEEVNYDEASNGEVKLEGMPEIPGETTGGLEIQFHYTRPKADYDNWGLWLWDDIGTPAIDPYPCFTTDDESELGEKVISYDVATAASWVGFIVRDADFKKDPDNAPDRRVDVLNYVAGTIHVTLNQDTMDFDVDYSKAYYGTKITKATYDLSANAIVVNATKEVADYANAFKVFCEGEEVAIKAVSEDGKAYTLTFEEELDAMSAYTVVYNGRVYNVTMPDYYSTEEFEAEYTYSGNDLGATYSEENTVFKVWAPTAAAVSVKLYDNGEVGKGNLLDTYAMTKGEQGVWEVTVEGDLNGRYYTYLVAAAGTQVEACDPYARTTGVNGNRAMILDLDSTDPEGWENDTNPHAGETFNDAVIYELHVRDASIDESSPVSEANKGNFLGVSEAGEGKVLEHMVALGITHLHLLPAYDFSSVDETKDGHNWGYDPKNYNVPEGSYSSDPYNGEVRVSEMKQMVQELHENNISVVMDVVYNHVSDANGFCFNQIVPGYFSRPNSNGSGCGNDTASERSMVHKYIVDSVKYWADEYHIDGFRFDLVGLIDTETINDIMETVWEDHPDVVFYGEGWTMGTEVTKKGYFMTTQPNSTKVPGFAFFNDTLRDALKGSVFETTDPGYVSGKAGLEAVVEDCFVGLPGDWCTTPTQTVNYTSCHDNNTLIDRITISTPDATREEQVAMNNLAAAITLTSQGIPFVHAGEEFLRSKPIYDEAGNLTGYDHNSYASGDAINGIKWDTLDEEEKQVVYNYYKGLIAFRKAHEALRMTTAKEVTENIKAVDGLDANVTAFAITYDSEELFVVFNPNTAATTVTLPEGEWEIYVEGDKAGTEVLGTATDEIKVEGISATILVKADEADDKENPFTDVPANEYYTDAVLWAVEKEITTGLTATTFGPEASCTRGEVVTFLWRANGCPEPKSTEHNFIDVKESDYFYKAVLWAVEKGITTGMTKTTFAPNETVTRGQFVTFLYRAEGKPEYTVSNTFTDLKTGEYYYDAVLWAVENGVTTGLNPTLFGPEDSCTRGQVVTFLYRAYSE